MTDHNIANPFVRFEGNTNVNDYLARKFLRNLYYEEIPKFNDILKDQITC